MRRKRDPVPRARAAGHWLGGILLLGVLAAGVVVAAVLLWENLDVRQLAPALVSDPGPLPEPEPASPPGTEPVSFSVVLFTSSRNALFFPNPSYYPREIRRWRRLIESAGGIIRDVETIEELGTLQPHEVLIILESPCLSDAEVDAVQTHLRRGGSLVSNWAVGARDGSCEWRGWGTVREFSGAGDVRELATREALYLTVPGGTPLSQGLDPGSRIELRPEASMALHLPGARVYWSDWALNPAPDESGGQADVAATAQATDENGRIAWFGFHLSQAATPRDSLRLDRLVRNGITWAAGLVTASPAPWPEGKRAAMLLVEDVEAEFQNASAMADLLRELGLPGNFFAVSRMVMDDMALAEALSGAGEVGSHSSDHAPVAGLTLQDQSVRLRRSWAEIRGWTGVPPLGFRPPEEAFDSNTLQAWQEAGGRYVLGVNQARSASPEVHRIRGGNLVLLPRLLKDDFNVFVQEGALRTERLTEAFLEGTEKLRALGGLAAVSVHTQIIGSGRRLEAVRAVADKAVAQGDWWITRASDVATWWDARSSVGVTVLPPRESDPVSDTLPSRAGVGSADSLPASSPAIPRHEVLVEAPEDRSISGLWIDIVLPPDSESLSPFVDDHPVPSATTQWGIRVPVGDLGAGEICLISLHPAGPESVSSG